MRLEAILLPALLCLSLLSPGCRRRQEPSPAAGIYRSSESGYLEQLASAELRRYFYLRTGELPALVGETDATSSTVNLIVLGSKERPHLRPFLADSALANRVANLQPAEYLLQTLEQQGRRVVLVAGGDELGALYGAYRLAERLGVRFYLHGDVLPDSLIEPELPQVSELGRPLFELRGIQPFHDFPEGPDWWNLEQYKTILAQLPKLRMNFFGLHTYPYGHAGPEPAVWLGPEQDLGQGPQVKFAYPARHFTTLSGTWGYRPDSTSNYCCGLAGLYSREAYGADYMRGMAPWPEDSAEAVEMFERFGDLLNGAFAYAGLHGIRTGLGTETPLTLPPLLAARLESLGLDPGRPETTQRVYEGAFRRIMQTHPLDYYWFWTPEGWTWDGPTGRRWRPPWRDLELARAAAEATGAPFQLATCGWVLGPPADRALFDRVLPPGWPVSCINREVGHEPVEPAFAAVQGRPKWAIPWLEDDPALIIPQLWAGRMRRDAVRCPRYGCTGLLGIHWRTRILGPNVLALAHAAWDQSDWAPAEPTPLDSVGRASLPRHLPAGDFYRDWAAAEFGPSLAEPAGELFARLDGKLPRPSNWVDGPGGVRPDSVPWEERQIDYAFVGELEALRPLVVGPGSLERFDYWLENFRYLREVGRVSCLWGLFGRALESAKALPDTAARNLALRERVLPLREDLAGAIRQALDHLLLTVTTTGELGTVTNWQQHVIPLLLSDPARELAALLGDSSLTAITPLAGDYRGPARLLVPVARPSLLRGEGLHLEATLLGAEPAALELHRRNLGQGEYLVEPLAPVSGAVYGIALAPENVSADLEWYLRAVTTAGDTLYWPPTAPRLNQTTIVVPDPNGMAGAADTTAH